MTGAAAKAVRPSLASFPRIRPLSSSTRSMKALRVGRPLDNDVERGYERPLIEDVTMARYFPFLNAMTLDTIELLSALTQAVA